MRCGYDGKPPTSASGPVGTGVAIRQPKPAHAVATRPSWPFPATAAWCWSPGRMRNRHCMSTLLTCIRASPATFHALHRMEEETRRRECCVRRRTRGDKSNRPGSFTRGQMALARPRPIRGPGGGPVLRDGDRDRDGDAGKPREPRFVGSSFCRAQPLAA